MWQLGHRRTASRVPLGRSTLSRELAVPLAYVELGRVKLYTLDRLGPAEQGCRAEHRRGQHTGACERPCPQGA